MGLIPFPFDSLIERTNLKYCLEKCAIYKETLELCTTNQVQTCENTFIRGTIYTRELESG